MPWFRNKTTGVCWNVEGEAQIDISRINTDLEELEEAPENAVGEPTEVEVPVDPSEGQEDPSEDSGDPLDAMTKDELVELAKSMEIGTSGKSADKLREAIRSKQD